MNVALKTAIVQSGKKQKQIARRTKISEARLSHIIHRRIVPHDDERAVLAKVLERPEALIFPNEAA